MKLSLMVRGQHPAADDIRDRLADDLELVRRAEALGFDGIVKGSHYSAHPFQALQQVAFLAHVAAIAPRLRIVCGLYYCRCTNRSISPSNWRHWTC
ncbi:MAG: LLM class flavin-dependent oxidoreductase [Alphaproteobacteria bacterium]|nr:LLM class flavin-dependent oxidoreductase [Alphaproteobacteria bacterium]